MNQESPYSLRREWKWLFSLLLIALSVRVWHLATTEVTARDSVHFIRMAWRMAHQSLREVLPSSTQHPGYPATILGFNTLIEKIIQNDLPLSMQISSQLVSILASLLVIFPSYRFSRELFPPFGAWMGALLIQILPATARLFADGLSESLFLFFTISAVWWVHAGLKCQSVGRLFAGGFSGGLAYLTRPEGLLVFLVAFGVVVGFFIKKLVNKPSRGSALLRMACLVLGFFIPALPFVCIIGKLTSKPTAMRILEGEPDSKPASQKNPHELPVSISSFGGVFWATWYDGESSDKKPGMIWGLRATLSMMVRGLFFIFWLPALLCLFQYWEKLVAQPGCWIFSLVAVAIFCVLVRVASQMGYVSDRHLLLVMVPCYLLAGGYLAKIASDCWKWSGYGASISREPFIRLMVIGLSFLIMLGLIARQTLEPLHSNRAGFKAAGYWIRENGKPGDEVIDTYCWSHFYAGRVMIEEQKNGLVRSSPPVQWVVLEHGKSRHARLNAPDEKELVSSQGQKAFFTQLGQGESYREVVVYKVPLPVPVFSNGP